MATTTKNEAVEAAISEGLSVYTASRHVGGRIEYLGHSWEDGGLNCDDDGNPRSDVRGNTIATHAVEDFDPASPAHVALAEAWYSGE